MLSCQISGFSGVRAAVHLEYEELKATVSRGSLEQTAGIGLFEAGNLNSVSGTSGVFLMRRQGPRESKQDVVATLS